MERLHDVFDHPHELVIRGGWNHALHQKVTNGLCGIAKSKREHCQDALDEVFWGERLSSSKLHHDIGEREGEAA